MRKFFVILLILQSLKPWAQELPVKQNTTEYFQLRKEKSLENISTMNWFQADTFGLITAEYNRANGDFYSAQDAKSRRDLNFVAEGLKKIQKIRFYGSVNFQHFKADSVGNTLRYGYGSEMPYYFYAFRRGTWGGVKYDFKGMLDWEINNKLHLRAGIKYKAENSWRTIDPRPEIFDQHQEYGAALEYKFNEKNSLSAGASIVINNQETNVGYTNDNLVNRFSDTIYINHIMFGYGYGIYWTTSRNIFRSSIGTNMEAAYRYQSNMWNLYLNASYRRQEEDVTQRLTESGDYENSWFGIVYYDVFKANALTSLKKGNNLWYANFSFESNFIQDDNKILKTPNYSNYKYISDLKLGNLIYKDDRPVWEFSIKATYQDWYRRDGGMGVIHQYDRASFKLNGGKLFYLNNKKQIHAKLEAGYSLPAYSLLRLGFLQNTFIDRVVKFDYYYHNADWSVAAVDLQYLFPIENLNSFVGLKVANQWAGMPKGNIIPRAYPGSTRTDFQLRFGIFL